MALIEGLGKPVAAASIGQVFKAHLPGKGDVAVKVQRPGVRQLVEVSGISLSCYFLLLLACISCPSVKLKLNPSIIPQCNKTQRDTELLLTVAQFLESLPALPASPNNPNPKQQMRLINTQLVSDIKELFVFSTLSEPEQL